MTKRTALKKHDEKPFVAEAIQTNQMSSGVSQFFPITETLEAAENVRAERQIGANMALDCFSNKELKQELERRITLDLTPTIEWYANKETRGGTSQIRLSAAVGRSARLWLIPAYIYAREDLLFINLLSYQKELLALAVKDQINAL